MPLTLVDHPLALHTLTRLRDTETSPEAYRHLTRVLSTLLILEASRAMETSTRDVRTPLETTQGYELREGLAVVPVLRAGLAMLEAALALFSDVAVGYVGLERNEETAEARRYYVKLPPLQGRLTLCVDPMLATGGSASHALTVLREHGAERLALLCIVAAPEGVARVETDHPDVPIFAAALDRELNDRKYILPGLGDFGDRLYGTL